MPDRAALEDHVAFVTGGGSGLGAAFDVGDSAAFDRSVGAEVAPLGIRVNAVAPGFIDTPLLDPLEVAKPVLLQRIPAARMGRAEEVAEAVRYLVVDATYSFGEIIPVSGGWLA